MATSAPNVQETKKVGFYARARIRTLGYTVEDQGCRQWAAESDLIIYRVQAM
jgi:hypothetical protein